MDFFNDVCQGENGMCGIGFVLYFSNLHSITGKANLGNGTNNKGKFQALHKLSKCALKWIFHALQAFRDSKLTIDWINDGVQLTNITLLLIN